MYKVIFYKDVHEHQPVKEYMDELSEKSASNKDVRIKLSKVYEYIEVLKRNGTRAGRNYVKYVRDGVWELRPLKDRILFFYWRDNMFVLLHQFQKKTRKTPEREIEKAIRNKDDFIKRSGYNE
ncbi:MAG: type II toxin-antitoxin system RelE/ParE family toxin [Lachnospiraceae bacterium]|nr:type II toxin-antitoxin system RelE/ParE family toxin [Lachnospiraceae bacterium]